MHEYGVSTIKIDPERPIISLGPEPGAYAHRYFTNKSWPTLAVDERNLWRHHHGRRRKQRYRERPRALLFHADENPQVMVGDAPAQFFVKSCRLRAGVARGLNRPQDQLANRKAGDSFLRADANDAQGPGGGTVSRATAAFMLSISACTAAVAASTAAWLPEPSAFIRSAKSSSM